MKKRKKLLLFSALVLVAALLFSSVSASANENPGRGQSLAEARKALEQELLPMAGAGFVGIAHSEAEGEVIVLVEDEQTRQRVPRSFKGHPVRTKVTGRIETLSTQVAEPITDVSEERRDEIRPLVGGTSLSAYVTKGSGISLYAGTLGMVTYDGKILSNAHVIAMELGTDNFLDTGTPILQPGSGDGGRLSEQVGALEAYIPIDFEPDAENYADAAIGSIDAGVGASPGGQFDEEGNYWVEGWIEVSKGDSVRKSGRTTGVTTGEIVNTNASVWVRYGDQSAYFVDQILVAQENWSFAAPGDSGSAVDIDGQFVGLVFAGADTLVVINKAEYIIEELGIAVEPQDGQYSLTISSTPGGLIITPGESMFIYNEETVVDLVANPDEHYRFVEWTGDAGTIADINAASTTITMNGSYSVTAIFEPEEGWCSLTVSSIEGGSVTEPGEETFVYESGAVVDLVAQPGEHYHFVNWTGDVGTIGNPSVATTNITMNDSYSVTAKFELEEGWCSLTVSSTEGSSVTEPGEGTFIYSNSTVVDLVADHDEGHQFVKWTGNVSTIADVNAADTTIAMNSSYSITAKFETFHPEPMAPLTVSSTAGGSVITPDEGTSLHALGFDVSIVAEPDEGYQFINWSGDVDAIANVNAASTTITMDSSYSIRANFSGVGWCFIATAAYGTPTAEQIDVLREFRDVVLLESTAGSQLVILYYQLSPPVANFISGSSFLRTLVRELLVDPIVWVIEATGDIWQN